VGSLGCASLGDVDPPRDGWTFLCLEVLLLTQWPFDSRLGSISRSFAVRYKLLLVILRACLVPHKVNGCSEHGVGPT
jgi:hypothetical protein